MPYDNDGYVLYDEDTRRSHSHWLGDNKNNFTYDGSYNYRTITLASREGRFDKVNSAFVNFCYTLRQLGLFNFQQTRI